jgi:two-component system sensor histidine kinase HydH
VLALIVLAKDGDPVLSHYDGLVDRDDLLKPVPQYYLSESTMANDHYTELAELAGGFIHEIKNHLSTLGLNLQLLNEDFQDPQNQRERRALGRVQKLQVECQHLVDVSNDFLRFARLQELNLVPTRLGKIVEEMVDFFTPTAQAARIEIKTYLPADLPLVLLDPDMFKQALLNLMLNAEQAMPQGGEITIQASTEDTGCAVCLSIIDTGKGIPADLQPKIFKPFFSTKPGGTGLGLPTTRKIIESHHGTLDVQSEVDKGTKFTICLPRAT